MKHRASTKFWQFRAQLPEEIQRLADENFELLKTNPRHPSLHFKKVAATGRRASESIIARWRLKMETMSSGFGLDTIASMTKLSQAADILMTGSVTRVSEGVICPEIFSVKV